MRLNQTISILLFCSFLMPHAIAAPSFTSNPIIEINGSPAYDYSVFANDTAEVTITAPFKPAWLNFSSEPTWFTSTFAGGAGLVGFQDGAANVARFKNMYGIAIDSHGDLFIADTHNHAIRHIDGITGLVTTIAGSGVSGYADGFGSAALFFFPQGIDIDDDDNIYVADAFNHCIRRIDATTREVTTFAGKPKIKGSLDGQGITARMFEPKGIAIDDTGGIWIADTGNHQIRFIDSEQNVTTVAGSLSATKGSANGTGTSASFNSPRGMTLDPNGHLIIADKDNHLIRQLNTSTFEVTTIVGSGIAGNQDGVATTAKLYHPFDVASDEDGNLFFPDSSNHQIKRVDAITNEVSTIAGDGTASFSDGTGSHATFYFPRSVAIAPNGNLFISDRSNGSVREIALSNGLLSGTAPDLGEYNVTITATSTNGSTDQSFTIDVTAINQRPTIEGSPTSVIFENEAYSFTPTSDDGDDDNIIYSVKMLPSWASFNSNTGEIYGTPSYSDASLFTLIAITADDQSETDNAKITLAPFNILVKDVNRTPSIVGEPAISVIENNTYSFIPTFFDEDSDNTLTLSINNLPTWASFNEGTGEVSGQPKKDDIGEYENIEIIVSDNTEASNNTSSFSFSISVLKDYEIKSASSGQLSYGFLMLMVLILSSGIFLRIQV